ncbi:SdpI family protein [Methanorbis furvi]|uniref:Immunity protein SdpI n=1 Tax=Methanorbis furvi TaxID=3028299 RepID=A0AAE4MBX5_9EURY|nr:Immunity protein SdpI [Methanocorpusculaceae archaeon Ag1]
MKNLDLTLILTSIVCLLPIIPGLVLYDQLPDQLIIHWNASGQPDGYAPKDIVLFGMPLLLCGLNIFIQFALKTDPKINNASVMLVTFSKWIIPIISVIVMSLTLLAGLGMDVPINVVLPIVIGMIFVVIGNYLPKSKQSYTVGIRLPWTLNSEENWNRTHRLAGYLWIIGGVVLILSAFLAPAWMFAVMMTAIIVMVGVPFAYSYSLYRKGV